MIMSAFAVQNGVDARCPAASATLRMSAADIVETGSVFHAATALGSALPSVWEKKSGTSTKASTPYRFGSPRSP